MFLPANSSLRYAASSSPRCYLTISLLFLLFQRTALGLAFFQGKTSKHAQRRKAGPAGTQLANTLADVLLSTISSKVVILLLINLMLLILGCFLEQIAAILAVTPIILPIMTALGLSNIQSGLMPCLKADKTSKQRAFFCHTSLNFLAIRQDACENLHCLAKKFLAVGHIANYQTSPKAFWNHQHSWWFSFYNKVRQSKLIAVLYPCS